MGKPHAGSVFFFRIIMIPIHFISIATPVPYDAMLQRQEQMRDSVHAGNDDASVFLLEHEPVITMGRRAQKEHVRATPEQLHALGITVHKSDRGGDVTYHGPGQLVVYPVLDLKQWHLSVDWYLRSLEEVAIRFLSCYGLQGRRIDGLTGIWIGEQKVAAIGISIRHWVCWHGIALNVAPKEEHWQTIIPCGIRDRGITSLRAHLAQVPPMQEVKNTMITCFKEVFPCAARISQE